VRFVMFYHSLISDWNHGNAHFLRGVASELVARGHDVVVYEPSDGWSLRNLTQDHGADPITRFQVCYPELRSRFYDLDTLDLDQATQGADVVIVHEWSEPELVRAIGEHRRSSHYRLLFHDTHHRAASDPASLARFDLSGYDAVLAFGEVLRDIYLDRGWAERVYTWHEAADASRFQPPAAPLEKEGDLVWVGNWGDDERTEELEEFLLGPVRELGLRAKVYGVRYPDHARAALERSGIEYGGWLPNFEVPNVFARYRVTVHVPRRPYTRSLPGIPTIRPFEALACGIPLVSAPWDDAEGLFKVGRDYLLARDGGQMRAHLSWLLENPAEAEALAEDGRRTLLGRHTCAHRTDELLNIVDELMAHNSLGGAALQTGVA
jgi:spore maturation protein CgeB